MYILTFIFQKILFTYPKKKLKEMISKKFIKNISSQRIPSTIMGILMKSMSFSIYFDPNLRKTNLKDILMTVRTLRL